MREFLDKNTGITWVTPEVSKIEFNTPRFIQSDQRVLDEFTNELNENDCDDAGISEFVTGGDIRLGSFISWALDKFSRPFYAFDDGRLVGTAVINGHSDLDTIALEHFIDYLEANKRSLPDGMAGYLSHKRANKILASADDENNTDINYIIVIPKAQGRVLALECWHLSKPIHNFSRTTHSLKPPRLSYTKTMCSAKQFLDETTLPTIHST